MFREGHRNLKTTSFNIKINNIKIKFCLKFWGLSWIYKLKHYKTYDLFDNLNVVSGANLRLNTDDVIQNQERQLNAAKRSILRMLGNILKHIFLSCQIWLQDISTLDFSTPSFNPALFNPRLFLVHPSMFILF